MRKLMPIYLVLFFRATSWGIFDLAFPLYMALMGISAMNWGVLVAVFAGGMLFCESLWGLLSDRLGGKLFIASSLFLVSLMVPLYSFKEFASLFILLQFIRGAFRVMAGPSSRSFISDTVSSKHLGTAMGLTWSSMMTGAMVGTIVGSVVLEAWTYECSFYVSSVIALLTGIFALLVLREPCKRRRRDCYHNSRKLENRGFKVFLTRNPVILLILAIISMMALSLIRSFLPIFAIRQLNVSAVHVGITLAVFNGASVVMTPLFGRISYKIGEKFLIITGLCLYCLMILSYAFVKDIHQIVLVTFGAAVSFSLVNPSLLTLLTRSVTLHTHGAAMGVYGACEDLGVMIAPVIYGICWSTYGPASIFYAYPIIATDGVILSIMLREKVK